jgi:hypothetical protein
MDSTTATILVIAVAQALLCAFIAEKKKRNSPFWFVMGFLFLIVCPIILLTLPALRRCPSCGKKVNKDTKICGYCGHNMV